MANTTKIVRNSNEPIILEKEYSQVLINALEIYYQYLENHIDEIDVDFLCNDYSDEMKNIKLISEILKNS